MTNTSFFVFFYIHVLFSEVKGNNHRMARRRDKKGRGIEEGKKGEKLKEIKKRGEVEQVWN